MVDHEGEHFTLAGRDNARYRRGRSRSRSGVGKRTLELVREYADWWNVPLHQLDRLDERRGEAGDARESVQQMVALVPSEQEREEVTAMARRRFGGMKWPVVGTAPELAAHFDGLHARGVDRFYVWFADFAPVPTLQRFAEVIDTSSPLPRDDL